MGLDSYAARPVVEGGQRRLESSLPGRVVSARTVIGHDGKPYTFTGRVAFGFEAVPPMLGGLFSGAGRDGSFRGKCYAGLVEDVTGYSLYEDELPPPVVAAMADSLREAYERSPLPCPPLEAFSRLGGQEATSELANIYDLYALTCFFEACRDQGYSVVSWY